MDIINSLRALRARAQGERCEKNIRKLYVKEMPYVFGLMAVGASSGLTPEQLLRYISEYVPECVRESMNNVIHDLDAGRSLSGALTRWNDNEHLRVLAHVITESLESGTSSLAALDALSRDASTRVRRQADTALKKLPVTMLFPLVVCILPAFVLLSIVPTLIERFTSMKW